MLTLPTRAPSPHASSIWLLAAALAACGNGLALREDGQGEGGETPGTTTGSSVSSSTSSGGFFDTSGAASGGGGSGGATGIGNGGSGGATGSGDGGSGGTTGSGDGGTGGSGGALPVGCEAQPIDLWTDGELEACSNEECCAETTACAADRESCFADGVLDLDDPLGAALSSCLDESNCFSGGVCDSGIGLMTPDLDDCLTNHCCEEYSACTDGGGPEQCIDCIEHGGGFFCNAAMNCTSEHCGLPIVPRECDDVPDVILFPDEPGIDACGNANCCNEMARCAEFPGDCFTTFEGERVLNLGSYGGRVMQACMAENCADPSTMICDSTLSEGDPELAACLSGNCCEAFNECTDYGLNGVLCLDCFVDGPPYASRCAPAAACELEMCSE